MPLNYAQVEKAQTLFKLRTRMVNVRENFKSGHIADMWCRICKLFREIQQHLLECPGLRIKTKQTYFELEYQMSVGTV